MNLIEVTKQLISAGDPLTIATRKDAPSRAFRILWQNAAPPRSRIEHLCRAKNAPWEKDAQGTNFSVADLISNKWVTISALQKH